MTTAISTPMFDLVMSLSSALDLISPVLSHHHQRVAYIAQSIAIEIDLPVEEHSDLLWAALLHDSGGLSLEERLRTLDFELENPRRHARIGCRLLEDFHPLAKAAVVVRHHHTRYEDMRDFLPAHILHLADRVSVLVDARQEVLGQAERICERIKSQSGTMFAPELVDVLHRLAEREEFWFDTVSPSIEGTLRRKSPALCVDLDLDDLLNLTTVFSRIIDFRSRFTATHSRGVAASAEALATYLGFSPQERRMMRIAGCLHDLGKLCVAKEILEKPAGLATDEFNVVRGHTFYTHRILEHIGGFDVINAWASFHHERMDGHGYPFHLGRDDLSPGSRSMAVADVFTALTEDRPYRKGMAKKKVLETLEQMAGHSALDAGVVSLLKDHYDEMNAIRIDAQASAAGEYERFRRDLT